MNLRELREQTRLTVRRGLRRVARRVPPGWRLVAGILLICGGFLAILPVFGLWMIPLGFLVAALDVRPMLRRWRRGRTGQAPLTPEGRGTGATERE